MALKVMYTGVFRPSDKDLATYRLFPFPVFEGAKWIEINYDYDHGNGNILDLGLFDNQGTKFLTPEGFRGWSGSAKNHIIVAENFATPGYLEGPIRAGTWHVVLGLYQINSESCAYQLEILIHDTEYEEQVSATTYQENFERINSKVLFKNFKRKPNWLRGDLHSHTHHSDAQCTVDELVYAALKHELDFIAITDHNTVSHFRDIQNLRNENVCVIPGEEITTYYGHANVWSLEHWLDFRCITEDDVNQICYEAHRRGCLFSINHPKPNGPNWELGFSFPFDCIEVWQSLWFRNNEHSLALWDSLLRKGRKIIAVGGSDTHPIKLKDGKLLEWLGQPTTWVYTNSPTAEAILKAIANGHVTISACPSGPFVTLECWISGRQIALQGDTVRADTCVIKVEVLNGKALILRILSQQGELFRRLVESEEWVCEYKINLKDHGYVRAELRVPTPLEVSTIERMPLAALTNPIWHCDFVR